MDTLALDRTNIFIFQELYSTFYAWYTAIIISHWKFCQSRHTICSGVLGKESKMYIVNKFLYLLIEKLVWVIYQTGISSLSALCLRNLALHMTSAILVSDWLKVVASMWWLLWNDSSHVLWNIVTRLLYPSYFLVDMFV